MAEGQAARGRGGIGVSLGFGVAAVAAQAAILSFDRWYGYHRNELYYLDAARHLGWGYADFPPLSPALLWLTTALFGESLWAVRLPAMAVMGAAVAMGGVLAREMGGGRGAQALAALTLLFAPYFVSMGSFYSMNPLDCLLSAMLAWIVVRMAHTDDGRWWYAFGAVAGLGVMNKFTFALYAAILIGAVAATPQRRLLAKGPFWGGLAVAAAACAPHFLWQMTNGWPTLEFIAARNAGAEATPLGTFVKAQLMWMGPAAAAVWLAGLLYGVATPAGRRYLAPVLAFAALFAAYGLAGWAPYTLAPAYPAVVALGAVALAGAGRARTAVTLVLAVSIAAGGAFLAPNAAPILAPKVMTTYQWQSRMPPPPQPRSRSGRLAPPLGDRMGWPWMAEAVAKAYGNLPEADRAHCAILTSSVYEAGALNVLGPALGLPPAIAAHRSGYLWGPGAAEGQVVLALTKDRALLEELFGSVVLMGHFSAPYVMAYQDDRPLYLCRDAKAPMAELWPKLKRMW